MADPRFEPNLRGYRDLLTSAMLYPALEHVARPIEGRARANAAPHHRTGEYEASIHTERQRGQDRVRVRVISDDDKAAILESRYHVFGRAAG